VYNFSEFEFLFNIFLAFIGGIIMNFMPCILPLISLKISSFLGAGSDSKLYLKKNIAYSGGVFSFFICLGILISFLKITGQNFIFGSHMQSGFFLFIIFGILILIGFNLAGLFEFQIHTLTNKSSNFLFKFSGLIADYLNGLLVSFLAVPCTAPFIASAFAFALKSNVLNIFLITFFMGFGFAFPFVLAIIFPNQIMKIIPKPGQWMEKFKNLMSFPIFGTAAWIFFVLIKKGDLKFCAISLFFLILSYFFIWFWQNFFENKKFLKILIFSLILLGSYFLFPEIQEKLEINHKPEINSEFSFEYGLKQDFSKKKFDFYKNSQKRIFVVASASWCLTCHVNEKNALSSEAFLNKLKQKEIIYLYIDLTNHNEDGQKFLEEFKQVGIPFYLTIDSKGKQKKLSQILKPEKVLEDLENLE
jgi:thiol:disulfide interchange protein